MNYTPETKIHDEVQTTSQETKPDIPNFLKTKPSTADDGVAKGMQHTARASQQVVKRPSAPNKLQHVAEVMDVTNKLSEVGLEADLDQFDDRIEGLTGDIAECDTDLSLCETQMQAWNDRFNSTQARRDRLSKRRNALRTARRALMDAMEGDV